MKTENILCVYHSADNDGRFSGAIVKSAYPDAIMIGWNHGDKQIDIETQEIAHNIKFDKIIICDLPFLAPIRDWTILPHDELDFAGAEVGHKSMMLVAIKGKDILWFDHHIGNMREMVRCNMPSIAGSQRVGDSAAKQVYEYFSSRNYIPTNVQCIKYVDTYDCWKKENGLVSWKQALAFNSGMNLDLNKDDMQYLATKFIMNYDEEAIIDEILQDGHVIKRYLESQAEWIKESLQDNWIKINNITILHANVVFEKSYMSELLNNDKDVICLWSKDGETGKYIYSLRTKNPDIDVSLIAEKYNGGGHKAAAGFSTKTLIFED